MKPINILHIEDDEDDVTLVKLVLNEAGISFSQTVVSSKQSLLNALQGPLPDIILSDHSLPAFNSLEALKIVKQKAENLPFILVTGNTSEEFAVNVIKAGADDYILKDRMQRLPSALLIALEKYELADAKRKLKEEIQRAIQEKETFTNGALNSLSSQIAVINSSGTIVKVNDPWNTFALNNGAESLEKCGVGANYFDVCRGAGNAADDMANQVLVGIEKVFSKTLPEFYLEYPCHSPQEERWFYVRVMKFESIEPLVLIEHHNISNRKKAEHNLINSSHALKHSLNVHEKIMKSSLDVICSIDKDGKFVNVSAACEEIWGYTPPELCGRSYMDLVFEEDVEITIKAATAVMNGIVATNFENRYRRKDGSIVTVLWSARWDENDKLIYCIAKNITDRKKLEKAFEVERQRFYDLFLQAPSCMGILKGADYMYEMANPLYLQLIDKKDIIGKTVKEVLPEMESQGVFKILDSVYYTGKTFSANEMLVKFDFHGTGKLVDRYLNFIYQAHRNEGGDIDGILFFVVDVTEQVLSRQKIEANEKKFRQIVETAQEGIWMIDENNTTIFVNRKMCDILEYEEEEMLGKSNLFFKEEEEQKIALQHIERRKKGIKETHEAKFVTKSGRRICTQVSTNAVLDKDGMYKGALAMITDITEKKELQQQLVNEKINKQKQITRATLEAQEKERNYLGGELHDNINQILAAVKLQLSYSLENLTADKTVLVNAQKNVELAMEEIRNLSQKLVTHRFGEELFVPLVKNLVLQLFAPGMVTMNIAHFDESIANEIKLTLYRIIQEHLNNIIKHAGAQHITLSICSNTASISVMIEDDGIGFNLNQNRNGVGLTNIYNRAESYNGTITITTEPGKGCKLKAVLPTC
jgi:PAS domain S-box-containing protein